MASRELSALLWEERQLLDLLVFKLEEESVLLLSGRHHCLARATSEVEFVLGRIREMEVRREAEVAALAAELGLGSRPTLAQIADEVPEPWSGTFREHRKAIRAMVSLAQEVAQKNREVLARYVVAVSDALAIVGTASGDPQGPSYGPDGVVSSSRQVRLMEARV